MTPAPDRARLVPDEATAALAHDPVLGPFIARVGPVKLRAPEPDHFATLVRAIVYQQLGGAAAATIHGRLVNAVGGRVSPDALLGTPEDALRAAGLSRNKLAALRDLASKVDAGVVPLDDLDTLSDDRVVQRLGSVRGIGTWTANMFLIFQLGRPDVWPTGDLGVRKGYALLHRLGEVPSPREIEPLGERFRPWRSAAAWYCWRATDTVLPDTAG